MSRSTPPQASPPQASPPQASPGTLALVLSPTGTLYLDTAPPTELADVVELPLDMTTSVRNAFGEGMAQGLLHLATADLPTNLPPSLAFGREIGHRFFTALCHTDDLEASRAHLSIPLASED